MHFGPDERIKIEKGKMSKLSLNRRRICPSGEVDCRSTDLPHSNTSCHSPFLGLPAFSHYFDRATFPSRDSHFLFRSLLCFSLLPSLSIKHTSQPLHDSQGYCNLDGTKARQSAPSVLELQIWQVGQNLKLPLEAET